MHWPRTEAAEVANAMIEAEFFATAPCSHNTPRSNFIAECQAMRYIVRLIRSYAGGSNEARCGLCYDQHHVWRVTVVMTLCAVTANNVLLVTRLGFGGGPRGQPPYLMPKG